MRKGTRLLLQSIFLFFTYSLIWIGLWIIGFYLSQNGFQATLFLPQGLRLALMIILWRRYWPTLLVSEVTLNIWLAQEQLLSQPLLLLSPLLSLTVAYVIQDILVAIYALLAAIIIVTCRCCGKQLTTRPCF